jgi:SAM-dependent methyltransferase
MELLDNRDACMNYLREMAEGGYTPASIGHFHKTMLPYLADRLRVGRHEMIVDVGTAQGHCAISLKQAGYEHITVVDREPYNFPFFKSKYGFTCIQCDVTKERIALEDESVAFVVNFHLIEHLDQPGLFLDESLRILRPGGAIAVVTPDWRKQFKIFYRDPTHIRPYDKAGISRLLRMHGFKDVTVSSWGSAYGFGRLKAYRVFPRLGMIGIDMIALGTKEGMDMRNTGKSEVV